MPACIRSYDLTAYTDLNNDSECTAGTFSTPYVSARIFE